MHTEGQVELIFNSYYDGISLNMSILYLSIGNYIFSPAGNTRNTESVLHWPRENMRKKVIFETS
jgi:hypothetical protein